MILLKCSIQLKNHFFHRSDFPQSLRYKKPPRKTIYQKKELAKRQKRFKGKYIFSPKLAESDVDEDFIKYKYKDAVLNKTSASAPAPAAVAIKKNKTNNCLSDSSNSDSEPEGDNSLFDISGNSRINLSDESGDDGNLQKKTAKKLPKLKAKSANFVKLKATKITKQNKSKKPISSTKCEPLKTKNKNSSSKFHLGGIFTVQNGWDKPVISKAKSTSYSAQPKKVIVQKVREPPKIIQNNTLIREEFDDDDDDDYSEYAGSKETKLSEHSTNNKRTKENNYRSLPNETIFFDDGNELELHANE
jgi:hypothetical protein